MTKIKMLYKQLYYNTLWYINIVLTTNNMFLMSKATIYIFEVILNYINFMFFMITSSIPFPIMHKLLDLSCYNIAHNVFICTYYKHIYQINIYTIIWGDYKYN